MRHFLSIYGRGGRYMLKLLAVCTLIALISFISRGEFWLVGALFAGYVAAFICCWSLTNRMGHTAFDLQKATRQIVHGPFIRMGSLFLILGGVAQFSAHALFTAAGGYFLFMLLALGCLLADRCHGGEKN